MFETKYHEYKFETKEQAEEFKNGLNKTEYNFGPYKATLRKSLPEFKGHANPGYSVFVKAFSIADEMKMRQIKEAI